MSKEAMKLALEALEQIARITGARWALENSYAGHLEAITALREALSEQPAQDDPDLQDKDPELVEQPAQHEPFTHYRHYDNGLQDWADEKTIPLYTFPPAQQEPVAYWIPKAEQFCIASPSGRPFAKAWEPLYTSPPAQRKPLTFSKLCDIEYEITHRDGDFSILKFARAIEAAHGIKEKNT